MLLVVRTNIAINKTNAKVANFVHAWNSHSVYSMRH